MGDVGDLEVCPVGEILRDGELRGVLNAGNVEVEPKNAAAEGGGDLQRVAAGATADFEDVRVGGKLQSAGYCVGFFGGGPAGLAEVLAVSGNANLTVDIGVVVGVSVVVEVDGTRHRGNILHEKVEIG